MNPGSLADWQPPVRGPEAWTPIVILCDAPTLDAWSDGLPLDWEHHKWLAVLAKKHGFGLGDIRLLGLCPPVDRKDHKSSSRKWKHVESYLPKVRNALRNMEPRVVVTFGEMATRAMLGRPVAITKIRGVPVVREGEVTVLPMLSPGYVNRIPDHIPTFSADMATLARIKDAGFDAAQFVPVTGHYEWVTNLGHHFDMLMGQTVISVDTETQKGTRWWDPEVKLLSVQITYQPGHALVIPVCDDWCGWRPRANYSTNRKLLKRILERKSIRKIGHNIKFEHMQCRKIGIEINGWLHDTQLMLFNVDENMLDKKLESGVKIYVPEMSGYSDEFDQTYDKSNMAAVPQDDFIQYSGGDADATFRLARRLKPLIDADPAQRNCYRNVQLPALLCFANTVELHGMKVNQQKLEEFGVAIDEYLDETYRSLIARAPAAVKADHLERGKELKFSRPDFVRDVLFAQHGFNLQPLTFTATTEELDPEYQVASTSAKKHLPYFTGNDTPLFGGGTVGDYVNDLMQYQKAVKLKGTYVGERERGNGLWQYLAPNSRIYPSYMLHRTNTGRTASADPNGQNMPVRGPWAKRFKEVFEASSDEFTIVSCDLSQIELRLVAWASGDPVMMRVYLEGGDIHAMTAASTLGVDLATFMSWKGDDQPLIDHVQQIPGAGAYLRTLDSDGFDFTVGDYFSLKRFQAKAINFGLIYGMSARGLRVYAKTDYGIDWSEQESYDVRAAYFSTYSGLPVWHQTMHRFVQDNRYVRALHGAVRHLPSIDSEDSGIRAGARRHSVNSPIQRFGSDLGIIAMTRFSHQADPRVIRVHGFIHDALYMEVRNDLVEEAASALKWTMQNLPLERMFGITPPLPILSDAEIGGEERPDIEAIKPDWWDDDEAAKARKYLAINRSSVLRDLQQRGP